jgi:hypothetical protein
LRTAPFHSSHEINGSYGADVQTSETLLTALAPGGKIIDHLNVLNGAGLSANLTASASRGYPEGFATKGQPQTESAAPNLRNNFG